MSTMWKTENHATVPLMPPMSSHHPCVTMSPCHYTTYVQPCHHSTHAITPPMRNHATHATHAITPPMCNHATHAVCCIIVFYCWLSFASVPFYQNWVSAVVVQVNVIRESLWYSNPWRKRMLMPSGINVMGHQCDGASMWSGINVTGHQCDRASMWLGIIVIGHQCDRASMWSIKFNIFLYLFQNIYTIA